MCSCSSEPLVSFFAFYGALFPILENLSLNSGQHPERIKRFSIETYGKSHFG
jgi:hypothetical protein